MGVQLICRIFFTETLQKFHNLIDFHISMIRGGEVQAIRKKREDRLKLRKWIGLKTFVGGKRYGW